MTLVLTFSNPESIWLLVDRRLSFSNGRPPKDDAIKAMFLETDDTHAVLGYAGLGLTALGSEPSQWMSNVLRGQKRTLKQSLLVLAQAAAENLGPHLKMLAGQPQPHHVIRAAAVVNGKEQLWRIEVSIMPDGEIRSICIMEIDLQSRLYKHIGLEGTGGQYLRENEGGINGSPNTWIRDLRIHMAAYNRGAVNSETVADYLAELNYEVSQSDVGDTVGPNCIVAWRNKHGGIHKMGGGHWSYTNQVRDHNTPRIPMIGNGLDIRALGDLEMKVFMDYRNRRLAGEEKAKLDENLRESLLETFPTTPDKKLK